jgi:hypothetical protein
MNHREKEAAVAVINLKLNMAKELMEDCVKLAEHAGVVFSLPWGGEGTDQRGMGADYVPQTASQRDKDDFCNDWCGWGWQPSAGTC